MNKQNYTIENVTFLEKVSNSYKRTTCNSPFSSTCGVPFTHVLSIILRINNSLFFYSVAKNDIEQSSDNTYKYVSQQLNRMTLLNSLVNGGSTYWSI